MKPRLQAAPWTEEDLNIWLELDFLFGPGRPIYINAQESDRRDADLVLFQMGLSTRLKPWANYIRWCDLNPGDDWRAQ